MYDKELETMTMHLLPAYYTTTKTSKKSSAPKTAAQIEHEKWLEKKGLSLNQIKSKKTFDKNWKSRYNESLKVDRSDYVSMGMSGSKDSCVKKGIMVNLHKESKEVQQMIAIKASRVAPAYSKGGYQYITPETDLTDLGKKK